jgi:ribosome biogenesis protein Nip4
LFYYIFDNVLSKPEGESIRKELSKQIKDTFLHEEKVKQPQFKALSDDAKKKMNSTAKKNHVSDKHLNLIIL